MKNWKQTRLSRHVYNVFLLYSEEKKKDLLPTFVVVAPRNLRGCFSVGRLFIVNRFFLLNQNCSTLIFLGIFKFLLAFNIT